ncbi:MAG: phosphatase PAP2 family protein [Alphaproteobacteria bacterium]
MIRGCIAALAATLALFHWTSLDLRFQSLLFNAETGQWILSKQEPIARLVFYDGPRLMLIVAGIAALLLLAGQKWIGWARNHRRGLIILVLSLALVPTTVAVLKKATNVACPGKVEQFGGPLPHVDVFDTYPDDARPDAVQRCFPAGHASGGYALLGLIFLFRRPGLRVAAGSGAIAAGSLMGAYKMAIGDHFLSHTIVSLELAILIVAVIAVTVKRFEAVQSKQ